MRKRVGPLDYGDRVQLTDQKGKLHSFTLTQDGTFHTHRGWILHKDLVGCDEGSTITTSGGAQHLVFRPLYEDFVLGMKRGATIIYPKDAATIVTLGDISPGARVIEAGAGSGAISIAILERIGSSGSLTSYERRTEFAENAKSNVASYFGEIPQNWSLIEGSFPEDCDFNQKVDRIVLDMLAPWECIDGVGDLLSPGGVLICYVATTTQLSQTVEKIREHAGFSEPTSFETMYRTWHVEGLAVRPDHRMVGHTGFISIARKLAPGVIAPARRRRPAKGAYGLSVNEE